MPLVALIGISFITLVVGCGSQGTNAPPRASTQLPANDARLARSDENSNQGQSRTIGRIEKVAEFPNPMPTGVTVSGDGRIFVCIPRWVDATPFTVGELRNGQLYAYPNADVNRYDEMNDANTFVSVQSVVVAPDNRLWVLDTGSINMGPARPFGPKLVCVDLTTNQIVKKIQFPPTVVLATTYLNDIRFDLRKGNAGVAYITDSAAKGPGAIIVVDLDSGNSWRRLSGHKSVMPEPNFVPRVEGEPLMQREKGQKPKPLTIATDGIAISADGSKIYYTALAGHHLYSVSADALADRNKPDAEVESTVEDLGDRGFASDGLESDSRNRIYLTDYENTAIRRRDGNGQYTIVAQDSRMIWPDTMSVARDGYLYFMVNQLDRLPRFHEGQDLRKPPYALFRVKIDGKPVMLER
jgi:sugar lactone lactonase YvrE